jgi:2,5-furandicarboxylate decarboxylase 1
MTRTGEISGPSMYFLPHYDNCPEFEATAITMRGDRPIYRNHQTCPETDHQILPRLCHEAMVYNRLTELGLNVHEVRFPAWGGVFSCVFQAEYGRDTIVPA